jgi:thioester reductase-like protein
VTERLSISPRPVEFRLLIAITGATDFLGRYLVRQFAEAARQLHCWYRPGSDRSAIEKQADAIE